MYSMHIMDLLDDFLLLFPIKRAMSSFAVVSIAAHCASRVRIGV